MNNSQQYHGHGDKEINLDNLYSALVECFVVILCGYLAGRLNLISQRETRGLDVFVRSFSLPSVIFVSLAQLDISAVDWKFLGSILVSKSIVFVGVVIVTLCLIRPIHLGRIGLYAVFCTQSNDFALGFPILNALYGKASNYPSYVYLLAPISLAVLNPIAYVLLEIGKFHHAHPSVSRENITNENKDGPLGTDDQGPDESTSRRTDGRTENEGNPTEKRSQEQRRSDIELCSTVFINIVTNPVMLMTVLGLIGNLFYRYIKFVEVVLNAFASVFSTSALFVLGLRMVGSVHKLRGDAMITPGILIITKLLVLPLITREVVSVFHTGINANDTLNLSTFGFMYGTFPAAPIVFVLATQYEVEIDTMSSSLVVCTFLSAPLMYISAKMIFLNFLPDDNYYQKLESFAFNIGLLGIPVGIWLVILFVANKAFNKVPQKVTGFLIISQTVLCIGVALQPLSELYKPWTGYLQFSFLLFGIYSSRLWAAFLAVNLVLLQSRSLCYAIKLLPVFTVLAWGVPAILAVCGCFASAPENDFGSLMNSDFRYGKFQSTVALLVLSFSFVGTCICLILQHRYQRRFSKYLILVREVNSKDLQEIRDSNVAENRGSDTTSTCAQGCSRFTDIEEIVTENKSNACTGNCTDEGLCSSEFNCSERELCEQAIKSYNEQAINEDLDEDRQDKQILRHIVLLLFLVTSMFVNLMLSVWTLVVEDAVSGIYVELLFLNVILNIGQVFITFAVFGFESKRLFSSITNRWRRFYYGAETIVLTPVENLGFETTHVCYQFIAHYLKECENEIAKNKRLRLRMYRNCFKGKTLVSWLLQKRLAKDEAEAMQYACHLLEGRVVRHIENRHHFENSNLLYTFRQ